MVTQRAASTMGTGSRGRSPAFSSTRRDARFVVIVELRDLESVVRHGLCTGCGICESMAGRDKVEMRLTAFGQLRPRVKGPIDRAKLDQVLKVCPQFLAVLFLDPERGQDGGDGP